MIRTAVVASLLVSLAACGGDPPAKDPHDQLDAPPTVEQGGGSRKNAGGPTMQQELGSMDLRAVEKMFNNLLNGPLESKCHKAGRERVDFLSGDVKLFTRVAADGSVRYGYFEDSTLGDRETEKCILDVLKTASWPKPIGGEGEVRNAMSWTPGSERQPATWTADKVTSALDHAANKSVKTQVEACKSGASGFHVTAYVEPGELESAAPAEEPKKKPGKKSDPKKKAAEPEAEHGGKFKAIGMSASGKDASEKIDCLVDALKQLPLPSPGSYAAKVQFTL